jgi:DNA-binding transcriptional ArsR family regulator
MNAIEPITIKELKERLGMKWANMSRHIKRLEEKGFIIDVGVDGMSRVVQTNKFAVKKFLEKDIEESKELMERLI